MPQIEREAGIQNKRVTESKRVVTQKVGESEIEAPQLWRKPSFKMHESTSQVIMREPARLPQRNLCR